MRNQREQRERIADAKRTAFAAGSIRPHGVDRRIQPNDIDDPNDIDV